MVAGREACSCPECGTDCKGKFAGCVDVWSRGPRQVTVRVRPTEEPVRRSRTTPTVDEVVPDSLVHVPPVPPDGPSPRRLDDHTLAVIGQLVDKVQTLESAVSVAAHAQPVPVVTPPADDARLDALSEAVSGLAAGLDRLSADVKELRPVPERLKALEQRPGVPDPGGTKAVERLASDLARLSVRIDELTSAAARNGTAGLTETVARLSARVEQLDKDRARTQAAAQARPAPGKDVTAVLARLDQQLGQVSSQLGKVSSRIAPLDELAARVTALESAEAPTVPDGGGGTEALEAKLSTLEAKLSALQARPAPDATAQQGRVNAMERVLAGVLQSLERIVARVNSLDDVPKRLDALETAEGRSPGEEALASLGERLESLERTEGPQVAKALASMGKRLDRLSTQVGELKGLPERVRMVEADRGQAATLARGLGGAIDMIDQLSAQVTSIERRAFPPSPPRGQPGHQERPTLS